MRGKLPIAFFLAAVTGLAAAAPAPDGAPAPTRPAAEDLLGFSRYLPPEIDNYLSLLQAGRVWRSLADSRAVQRLLDTPEAKTFLAEARRELDPQKLPPEGRQALDLLAAAFDSEVVMALPPETTSRALNLAKAFGLSALLLVPSEFPPDSPPGRLLAQKREPFREPWERSLEALQVPPVILAARVKDAKRFDAFVAQVLDQGRRGFLDAVGRDAPPELRKALEGAWTVETIGGVTLHRFRIRLADLVTEETLDQSLSEARGLSIPSRSKILLIQAIRRLAVDVHVGFLGEYLTAVVSSDDRLVRQIVERFEGKAGETLAAAKSFERIRAALTPDAIGITYSEGRRTLKEFKELAALIQKGLDPELLTLLGAPPQILMAVERLRENVAGQMADPASIASIAHVEGVDTFDRGIRSVHRTEYGRPPLPLDPGPLGALDMVPDDAVGYYAVKGASWDGLWGMIQNVIEQEAAALAPLREQAASNPQLAEAIRRQEKMAKRILTPIREKLAPGLRGEMGFVLGPTAPLSIDAVPDVQGLPIPTGALIVHAAEPDRVIAGFRDLVRGIAESVVESGGGAGPLPVALVPRDVDGLEMHVLIVPGMRIEGFEPHLARVGKALVLSSSFAMTRRIRDAAEGRAPRIASSATHAAMAAFLDPKAWEVSFLDGGRVQAVLRTMADGIFTVMEREALKPPAGPGKQQELAKAKAFVREILAIVGCFRGHAASQVREGEADLQTEWAHFSDVEAK